MGINDSTAENCWDKRAVFGACADIQTVTYSGTRSVSYADAHRAVRICSHGESITTRESSTREGSDGMNATSDTEAGEAARVLHAFLNALEALDIEHAANFFAEDGVVELPYAPDGFPGYHVGREAIGAFLRRFPNYYRRIRYLDRRLDPFDDGSGLVAEYRGEWETVKGRPYNNSYVALLWVQNGQITRLREFFNPLVWLASLGRTSLPPTP
jgi:ketosteroid isomerase-like protein